MTPNEKKYLQYGGIALGAGVLLYLVFGNKSGGGVLGEDPTGNSGAIPGGGSTLPFNAKDKAAKLYDLMKGMFSDQKKIMAVLNGVSQAQFGQIRTAFGRKPYNKFTGNQQEVIFGPALDIYPLEDWLENELTSEQYETLVMKYPNYLI